MNDYKITGKGLMQQIEEDEQLVTEPITPSSFTQQDLNRVIDDLNKDKGSRKNYIEIYLDIPTFKTICRMFGGFYEVAESETLLIRTTAKTRLPEFIDRYKRMFPRK